MNEFETGRQLGREDREGECQYLRAEIERLKAEYPYSEIDMDMHVEAVTKELRTEIERLKALAEAAYVEGTCEGRAEAQLGRGRAWIDSKARKALEPKP